MSNIITNCPKKVKSFGVSLTIKPVTHAADVDVKIASIKLICPFVVEKGNCSKKVPLNMSITNQSVSN
jgi:hypothetical protein